MPTEELTIKAQEALRDAQQVATAAGHAELTAEHLLGSLIRQPEGIVDAENLSRS